MKISVCMCTFNGARFLEEQLTSIYDQSRKPDEVIICDDGSTDGTVAIIEKFIDMYQLGDSWFLHINPKNLGYLPNFYQACKKCTGDIIFFADQDDVWRSEKIEKMCAVFDDTPKACVVCCKFGLVDACGTDVSGIMSPTHSRESSQVVPVSIESVFKKCEWPAMVLAFRREWYDSWRVLTDETNIPHDYLFCSKAAEEDGLFQLDLELAVHRLHGNNEAKEEYRLNVLLSKKRKLEEIDGFLKLLDSFEQEKVLNIPQAIACLNNKKKEIVDRKCALESGRITRVISNGLKHRHSIRLKTFVCDMLIVKQENC